MGGYNIVGRCIGYIAIASCVICSSCVPNARTGHEITQIIYHSNIDYSNIHSDKLVGICDSLRMEVEKSKIVWDNAKKAAVEGGMTGILLEKEKEAFELTRKANLEYDYAMKALQDKYAKKSDTSTIDTKLGR